MNKQKLTAGHYSLKSAAQRRTHGVGQARGTNRARRRGQALLMAVLLMVFAALLGATFITVVALNLSQTARSESKNDARVAAQAGLRYANDQITQSEEGENWRPEQVSPPPAPALPNGAVNPEYNRYYTPFERAQGWGREVEVANTGDENNGNWDGEAPAATISDDWAKLEWYKVNRGARVFVKVPDPRQQSSSNFNTPTYLLEVRPVMSGANKDTLQIDIIGRANDNESAFFRTTTNKGTSLNGGPFAFARFDGNYDAARGKTLETEITLNGVDRTATAPSIEVKDAKGTGAGMTLMLQRGTQNQSLVIREVKFNQRNAAGDIVDKIFLNDVPATGFDKGDQVRVVSTLMAGLNDIDDDGDSLPGSPNAATQEQEQDATDTVNPTASKVRLGMHVNGGLLLKEKAKLTLSVTRQDTVTVAGRIVSQLGAAAKLRVAANEANAGRETAMPASSDIGSSTYNSDDLKKLVRDASKSQSNDPTQRGGSVRSIAQPKIDGAFSRYRQLTKFAEADGAIYGYGPGVYIDNAEDVEKVEVRVVAGTPPPNTPKRYRALTISELHRLWQRKSFAVKAAAPATATQPGDDSGANVALNAYAGGISSATTLRHRLAYRRLRAIPGVTNNDAYAYPASSGSLEQRGVRGWVNPHEFLPRGVLIELRGDRIVITRDARSDIITPVSPSTETYINTPNPNKAWKTANGSDLSAPDVKTYRMALDPANGRRYFGAPGYDTPYSVNGPVFNGVIFAEGNVRIRGFLNAATARDITIVSMGNIYVEGSIVRIGSNARRIALLAKKNVTLNPTQFLSHVEGAQDRDVATAAFVIGTGGGNTLNISDASRIRIGDRLHVGQEAAWKTVTAINGAQLTLQPALASAVTNVPVRPLADPLVGQTGVDYHFNITGANNPWMRDMRLDDPTALSGSHRLAMLHASALKKAFDFEAGPGPAASNIEAKNAGADNIISPSEMTFVASGNPARDFAYDLLHLPDFDQGPPSSGSTRGDDKAQTLNKLWQIYPDTATVSPSQRWIVSFGGTQHNPGPDFNPSMPGIQPDPANLTADRDPFTAGVQVGPDLIAARHLVSTGYLAPGVGSKVPMYLTTSTGLFWRPVGSGIGGLSVSLNQPFNAPLFTIGSRYNVNPAAADDEELATAGRDFYAQPGGTTPASLRWLSRLVSPGSPAQQGSNLLAISPNPTDFNGYLADYRLGSVKVERDDFTGSHDFAPGMNIEVEATIFAQDGSWFVIPMPMNAPDVNGDGTVSPTEQTDATRYRRLNYRIDVIGNIVQNISPTADEDYDNELDSDGTRYNVNPTGAIYTAPGAMKTWLDSLAYPKKVNASKGEDWKTISYQAGPLPRDHGLYLPVTPDLMYTG